MKISLKGVLKVLGKVGKGFATGTGVAGVVATGLIAVVGGGTDEVQQAVDILRDSGPAVIGAAGVIVSAVLAAFGVGRKARDAAHDDEPR